MRRVVATLKDERRVRLVGVFGAESFGELGGSGSAGGDSRSELAGADSESTGVDSLFAVAGPPPPELEPMLKKVEGTKGCRNPFK